MTDSVTLVCTSAEAAMLAAAAMAMGKDAENDDQAEIVEMMSDLCDRLLALIMESRHE